MPNWSPIGLKTTERVRQHPYFFAIPPVFVPVSDRVQSRILPYTRSGEYIAEKLPNGNRQVNFKFIYDTDKNLENGHFIRITRFVFNPRTRRLIPGSYEQKYRLKPGSLKGNDLKIWQGIETTLNKAPKLSHAKAEEFIIKVTFAKDTAPAASHPMIGQGNDKKEAAINKKYTERPDLKPDSKPESANQLKHSKEFSIPSDGVKGKETEKSFLITAGKLLNLILKANKAPIEKLNIELTLIVHPSTGAIQRIVVNSEWKGDASKEQVTELLEVMMIKLNKNYRFGPLGSYVIKTSFPLIKQAGN